MRSPGSSGRPSRARCGGPGERRPVHRPAPERRRAGAGRERASCDHHLRGARRHERGRRAGADPRQLEVTRALCDLRAGRRGACADRAAERFARMDDLARTLARHRARPVRPAAPRARAARRPRGLPMIRAAHRQPGFLAALLHRLSGLALAVFLPIHFLTLATVLRGADALDSFLSLTSNPVVKLAEFALVTALVTHMTLGLRLLAIEFLAVRERTSAAVSLCLGA